MKWWVFVPLIAVMVAGCSGGQHAVPKTQLQLIVHSGHSHTRYTLTCKPPGGTAPRPTLACAALGDYLPYKLTSTVRGCFCAEYADWIDVAGVFNGRRLRHAIEVSPCAACGQGLRAAHDVRRAFAILLPAQG